MANWIQRLLNRLGAPAGASVSADIATVDGEVGDIETKVGTNVDAAGTTTLFARLRQIVDTYLGDVTIGLAALEALVDDLETRLGTPGAGTVASDVESIEAKVGTNVDAAGTTTLFARLKQIVDTYLGDATIGLAALEGLVDDLETRLGTPGAGTVAGDVESIETKVGTNVDAAGTSTLFARLKQIVDTYLGDATIGLAAIEGLVDDLETRLGTPGAGTVAGDVESIEAKVGTNADGAGTTTLFARLKQIVDTYLGDGTIGLAAIEGLVDDLETAVGLIKTETDQLPNAQHETEWSSAPVAQNVASAAAANLTAGSITATFPTGATRVRAILVATIHVANQADTTHHINFKVEGQKDAGGYGDLLDLTAINGLGLVNVDGAGDGWCGAIDVTALVDASGSTYTFRFVVDSDDAGSVNYITGFSLVLVYTM